MDMLAYASVGKCQTEGTHMNKALPLGRFAVGQKAAKTIYRKENIRVRQIHHQISQAEP